MTEEQRLKYNTYHRAYRKNVYYPKKKNEIMAYAKMYRLKYPEKHKSYVKTWRSRNVQLYKEYLRKAGKVYYYKNRESLLMYSQFKHLMNKDNT
jgi:hypothetical protein